MGDRDRERLKRSNMVLIGLIVLMLLYGQSGDSSLYLFGFKIDLPFATQQEAEQPEAEQTIEVEEPAQN